MIVQGNSFRIPLKDNSVHSCVTSFPYYGLRSYDLAPIILGGQSDCRHRWEEDAIARNGGGERDYSSYDGAVGRGPSPKLPEYAICQLCGAFYGSFGLEPTMDLHIKNAVLVCREIKRVLHPTGVFWLNYGDSYATSRNGRSAADGKAAGKDDRTFRDKPFSTANELPAKNLCMIPQRVAIALQADGWILRSAPQWVKRNPMPESVQDRPGNGHEYVFMLVKSERYYFDMEAVRKSGKEWNGQAGTFNRTNGKATHLEVPGQSHPSHRERNDRVPPGRALRTSDFFFDSLDAYIDHLTYIRDNGGLLLNSEGLPEAFVVNPKPYKYAHYATFPAALVAPMIKASPEKVCPECDAPWKRLVERGELVPDAPGYKPRGNSRPDPFVNRMEQAGGKPAPNHHYEKHTTGWQPTCKCLDKAIEQEWLKRGCETLQERITIETELKPRFDPIPAVILDNFCGSGTVGQVARELGRRFIGIDLSAKYLTENALPRSEKKTSQASLDQLPLFAPGGLAGRE